MHAPLPCRLLLLPWCLLLCCMVTSASGDSGVVRASSIAGPWKLTLFSSPTPFRAGPVDLSILVQDPETDEAILDATVNLMLQHGDAEVDTILVTATRADATNRLLYAALFDLPEPGSWQVDLHVEHDGQFARLQVTLAADPPLPPILGFWTWLSFPAIVIILFICNQWLSRTRGAGDDGHRGASA